jgi:hypothetical protein
LLPPFAIGRGAIFGGSTAANTRRDIFDPVFRHRFIRREV